MSSLRYFSHDKKRRPDHRRQNGHRLKSRTCFLVFRNLKQRSRNLLRDLKHRNRKRHRQKCLNRNLRPEGPNRSRNRWQ